MCRSIKEGGGRCYSHTSKNYEKALQNERNVENKVAYLKNEVSKIDNIIQQLEGENSTPRHNGLDEESINAQLNQLDESLDNNEISVDDYERESARLHHYKTPEFKEEVLKAKKYGEVLVSRAENELNDAKSKSKDARREMHTTYTGLKNLMNQIENEENPEKRRELQIEYNVGKRLGAKRKKAFNKIQENKEKASKLREEAQLKYDSAKAIPVDSVEAKEARDELILEGNKLEAQAYLKENNGHIESQVLINDKTGEYVPAKIVNGKYGLTWMILSNSDPSSKPTGEFISPPRGKTLKSRAKFWQDKGLRLGTVSVPGKAEVITDPDGHKKVVLKRSDGGYDKHAILVDGNKYDTLMKAEAGQERTN